MTEEKAMQTLKGKGNKRGYAVGRTAHFKKEQTGAFSPAGDAKREAARLREAIEKSRKELLALYRELCAEVGEGDAWIFLVQLYLLDDSLFSSLPYFYLAEGKSAEEAIRLSCEEFFYRRASSPYFEEITEDVRDISSRIFAHLAGHEPKAPVGEDLILVSHSPLATEIYEARNAIAGIIASADWDNTSAAALARCLFIPVLSGNYDLFRCEMNKTAIIDSSLGCAYIDPDLKTVEEFTKKKPSALAFEKCPSRSAHLPLLAETGSLCEAMRIAEGELCGIGLFRSEELYLKGMSFPDEEELFEAYRGLAETLLPRPLVIRTFSVSGLGSVRINKLISEKTDDTELYVFHNETLIRQLRAILRAAPFGAVAAALPCECSFSLMPRIKELLEKLCDTLRYEGREVKKIPIGAIIDSPAAAISSSKILDMSDFIIVMRDRLFLDSSSSELSEHAEQLLLERIIKDAKRKKKQALLSLGSSSHIRPQDAKKLGFSALILPPDDTDCLM